MLRITFRNKVRNMPKGSGVDENNRGLGPKGRIDRLRKIVTALIRHERLEGNRDYFDEARGYVELLIQRAQKHGDKHRETMNLADYWILEKDLIPKLFKVLAPRYAAYTTAYTRIHRLPTVYPGGGKPLAILELHGNPYPPVVPKERDFQGTLLNVLVEEMKKDYKKQKYQQSKSQSHPGSTNQQSTGENNADLKSANQSTGAHSEADKDSDKTADKVTFTSEQDDPKTDRANITATNKSLENKQFHPTELNTNWKSANFDGTPV